MLLVRQLIAHDNCMDLVILWRKEGPLGIYVIIYKEYRHRYRIWVLPSTHTRRCMCNTKCRRGTVSMKKGVWIWNNWKWYSDFLKHVMSRILHHLRRPPLRGTSKPWPKGASHNPTRSPIKAGLLETSLAIGKGVDTCLSYLLTKAPTALWPNLTPSCIPQTCVSFILSSRLTHAFAMINTR